MSALPPCPDGLEGFQSAQEAFHSWLHRAGAFHRSQVIHGPGMMPYALIYGAIDISYQKLLAIAPKGPMGRNYTLAYCDTQAYTSVFSSFDSEEVGKRNKLLEVDLLVLRLSAMPKTDRNSFIIQSLIEERSMQKRGTWIIGMVQMKACYNDIFTDFIEALPTFNVPGQVKTQNPDQVFRPKF
jgi:hypothetical protein